MTQTEAIYFQNKALNHTGFLPVGRGWENKQATLFSHVT